MAFKETFTNRIKETTSLHAVFLFVITVLSRLPFWSKFLYHFDSVGFALGMENYDVYLGQPHPPGYFLYVMAGKALNVFFQDPNTTFVWISVVTSGLAVVAIYFLGCAVFSHAIGLYAALLALTSPLFWFYGEVALNYAIAMFFNTWVALLCWQLWHREYKWVYLSPLALGCLAGIRQDFFTFLFPLWLFCVLRSIDRRKTFVLLIILGATIGSWFIPMVVITGGLERYLAAVHEYWQFHIRAFAIWNAGLWSRKDVVLTLLGSISYGLGVGTVFILFSLYALFRTGRWRRLAGDNMFFFGLWFVPALLFHTFLWLHPYLHKYGLFFLPGLAILLPGSVEFTLAELNRVTGRFFLPIRINQSIIIWVIIALNAVAFCFSKTAYSAQTIQEHDRNLDVLFSGIKANFQTENTIVIDAKAYSFYSYRHIQYYLPQFRTYLTDRPVNDRGQKRDIFAAVNGKTVRSAALRIPEDTHYVVYLVDPRDKDFKADLEAKHMRRILLENHFVLYYQPVPNNSR